MGKRPSNPQRTRSSHFWKGELTHEAPIPEFRFGQKVQVVDWFYTWQIWEIVWFRPEAESFIYRIISIDFELMNVEERFLSAFS